MQQCSPCGEPLYDWYGNPVMAQPWTTKGGQRSSQKGQSKGLTKGKGKGKGQKGKGKGALEHQVQYPPPPTCDWCGYHGHTEEVCRKKQREQAGCGRCGAAGHTPAECPHYLHVCELCGKTGHLQKVCRSAPAQNPKQPASAANDAQKPIPGLDPNGWRCNKGSCKAFNPSTQKNCILCKKPRPADDAAKDLNPFGLQLKKAGTEVVERVNLAADTVGTQYPLSTEDQAILARADVLKRHIAAARSEGLEPTQFEEELAKLKIPDQSIKPQEDRTALQARLLEIETKGAGEKDANEEKLRKIDKKELDEIAANAIEAEAWKSEYEAKVAIMSKARQQAKAEYDAARLALLERERARAEDQVRLTEEATRALNRTAAAVPQPMVQAPPQQVQLAQPLPQNMVSSDMFTKVELEQHLASNGITTEATQLVNLFCSFLDRTAATKATSSGYNHPAPPNLAQAALPDAVMVEVECSTDEEAEPDQTGGRPKKLKKVTQAVADTIKTKRLTKKTGLKGNAT